MKNVFISFVAFAALLFIAGCDDRNSIPPTCEGTGTVLFFRERNDNGTSIFDQSLSDYLAAHPEMRVISMRSMGSTGRTQSNDDLKMVIMQVNSGHTPPPVDDPSMMPLEKK